MILRHKELVGGVLPKKRDRFLSYKLLARARCFKVGTRRVRIRFWIQLSMDLFFKRMMIPRVLECWSGWRGCRVTRNPRWITRALSHLIVLYYFSRGDDRLLSYSVFLRTDTVFLMGLRSGLCGGSSYVNKIGQRNVWLCYILVFL